MIQIKIFKDTPGSKCGGMESAEDQANEWLEENNGIIVTSITPSTETYTYKSIPYNTRGAHDHEERQIVQSVVTIVYEVNKVSLINESKKDVHLWVKESEDSKWIDLGNCDGMSVGRHTTPGFDYMKLIEDQEKEMIDKIVQSVTEWDEKNETGIFKFYCDPELVDKVAERLSRYSLNIQPVSLCDSEFTVKR